MLCVLNFYDFVYDEGGNFFFLTIFLSFFVFVNNFITGLKDKQNNTPTWFTVISLIKENKIETLEIILKWVFAQSRKELNSGAFDCY